jgi:prolyl-tRNA synthetase
VAEMMIKALKRNYIMPKKSKNAISPTRSEDYPEWYQQVIKVSDLAETSAVRGCMVIKPWGYALWENIVRELDDMFKDTGVKNAYFPLFIPLNFLEKEAAHVEGFAKECAVVTHHRLTQKDSGGLQPDGKLQEPLIVRPTSETIIGESFSRWISSYRDLPVLINQWANVVRWEMRTRLFLRTSEFLWQEGHTAHATADEAIERTRMMLDVYAKLLEEYLAIPVIRGKKSPLERFPGAIDTLCIEAMMQDKKALQAGTSHFLGQNFARASNIKYQSDKEAEEFAWTTSWGVSTRLIGGLVMTHSDDDGLILPPKVASAHVVIMPIVKKEKDRALVKEYTESLTKELQSQVYNGRSVRVELDDRDVGSKNWDWIKKGVPIRVEVGPRDIAENAVFVGRRDASPKSRQSIPKDQFVNQISDMLDDIQNKLFQSALNFRTENTFEVDNTNDFYQMFTAKDEKKIHGGFARSFWCGSAECEEKIKKDLAVTIRCIPFDISDEKGKCICCNKTGTGRVIFSKSY